MNKLIRNEFKKLFSKKIIYIYLLIAIAYMVFNNVMYNKESKMDSSQYMKEELAILEKELSDMDYKLEENNLMYINVKTQYDITKLSLNYDEESWQYNYINKETIYEILYSINENTYGFNKNIHTLQNSQEEYEKILKKLNENDWKSFVQDELDNTEKQIKEYEEIMKTIKDKKKLEELNNLIEIEKIEKQTLEWRLEKDILYGNSFLSNKIEEYTNSSQFFISLRNNENKTEEENEQYNSALKTINTSKYYIENNINIKKESDARYLLLNQNTEYGVFIIIFGIIIAGTIISNEYQKGTIKLLLTRPYSRGKILFSKYMVSILMLIIFIIILILAQYLVGGITFGFNVFDIPSIEYDFNTNNIVTTNCIKYISIVTLLKLPMYILITTLAFALSTITINSAASVTITILGYIVSDLINYFIERVKWLKYFVTANWDLSLYLFGEKELAKGLNFKVSLFICLIYFLIMMLVTYIVFKKRDIKNV